MPALGESVTEGTVTRWLKAEGDQVEVDEPLLEVSTDKVDTEIPSPVAGTVTKILVGEDETVPVGADLAIIGGQAGQAPTPAAPAQQTSPGPRQLHQHRPHQHRPHQHRPHPHQPHQHQPHQLPHQHRPRQQPHTAAPAPAPAPAAPVSAQLRTVAPASSGSEAAAYVTPLVRKLASDNDVDLASLKGTGIGGRIRKQDVLDAAAAAKAASRRRCPGPSPHRAAASTAGAGVSPKRGTTEKMSRLRKVIAARMVESLQVSAQLTTVVEVDVTKIARLRDKAKRDFESARGHQAQLPAVLRTRCGRGPQGPPDRQLQRRR